MGAPDKAVLATTDCHPGHVGRRAAARKRLQGKDGLPRKLSELFFTLLRLYVR